MKETEFDQFAESYYKLHAENISKTGEKPDYFYEYKVADTASLCDELGVESKNILDFGSGIGNSIQWFRKYFPKSKIICADVSKRSIELSIKRFPGNEEYLTLSESGNIPLCYGNVDVIFTACVFHHIPHEKHILILKEFKRILKYGGLLVIFEHNPFNPLTVSTVRDCAFDKKARLISASKLCQFANEAGWGKVKTRYRIFFPRILHQFRPFEKYLYHFCLGAQYCVYSINI